MAALTVNVPLHDPLPASQRQAEWLAGACRLAVQSYVAVSRQTASKATLNCREIGLHDHLEGQVSSLGYGLQVTFTDPQAPLNYLITVTRGSRTVGRLVSRHLNADSSPVTYFMDGSSTTPLSAQDEETVLWGALCLKSFSDLVGGARELLRDFGLECRNSTLGLQDMNPSFFPVLGRSVTEAEARAYAFISSPGGQRIEPLKVVNIQSPTGRWFTLQLDQSRPTGALSVPHVLEGQTRLP